MQRWMLKLKFQSITLNHDTMSKKKLLFLIAPRSRTLSFRSSNAKPLSIEVSNSVGPLNVQRRGWSYAASASVPSDNDPLNEPKGRKMISKQERRAMVEAFVNRYREMNAGKFPTAYVTQKQVGGGYYFLREIIQDLEYKTKMNSSNMRDENLVKKEPFYQSKLLTTEAVKISSVNSETAKDRPSQDDFQSVVSDGRETVNSGYEHLEEKRGSQTSSCERRLSKEVEIISRPDNHCIASDSNLLEKCSEETYPSSLRMSNDVKTEEAVSSHSDSVAPESHLLQEEKERVSTPFSETYVTDYGKAQGHETKCNDIGNSRTIEGKNIEKAGYERREQAALDEEPFLSSLQVPNDVKTGEDLSSHCSDSVASERHQLKEETDHDSASFIEKSCSSDSEAQSHKSKFVDMENHPINEPKGRKRISKQERRAMVEAFVNRYREMNAGKFPTAYVIQTQVGGSYYFLREIIQDLKYKTKMNSSNMKDENLVKKEPFDQSKLLTTEAVKISSVNSKTAKDRPSQDDFQSVVSDGRETVNSGYEHLEEKRGSQTSSCERRLSKEVEIISRPDNHCIASDSNLLEKCSEETYPSSLRMSNDVKTEEAVSSHSDSVALESHLLQEEKERVSTPFSETYDTDYGKAQGHETEFNDIGNSRIIEGKNIEKTGYERREQAALEDLSEEPFLSSLQVPNDVKTGEDLSSHCSDSVASERHQLKEETDHDSASFIEKSCSSDSKSQSHNSKFVDMENHPISEEKSFNKEGYERKRQDGLEDLPGMDGPKHKMEQSQGSLELDESKIDNSNNRETSGAVVPAKSTLWGNLKSFADGIINFWRR